MANKYLVKIAKEMDTADKVGAGIAGTMVSLYGVGNALEAYHSGDVTGRQTLFHGTTKERADAIRREGLLPQKGVGSTKIVEDAQGLPEGHLGSKDLVFTTKDPKIARFYGDMQGYIDRASPEERLAAHNPTNMTKQWYGIKNLMNPKAFAYLPTSKVARINIPSQHGLNIVPNPEYDHLKKHFMYGIDQRFTKQIDDQFGNHVVFKDGVPTQYVKGSADYKRLTGKELLEHIKSNPGKFAKGTGKMLGYGALGVAGIPEAFKLKQSLVDYVDEQEKQAEASLRKDAINAATGAGMGALTEHFVSKSKTPWIKGLSMGGKGKAAAINGVINVGLGRVLDKN